MEQKKPTSNRGILEALRGELQGSRAEWEGLGSYIRHGRKGPEARGLYHERAAQASINRLERCGEFMGAALALEYPDGTAKLVGRHRCTHRLCPACGRRRGGKLAAEMAGALAHLKGWGFGPNRLRFATFTIPNVPNVAQGLEWIAQTWHRCQASKTWGRLIAGGFRCWEVKPGKDGLWNVHLHAILVLWAPRVPYESIREVWDRAAGQKCNIRFDQLAKVRGRGGRSKAEAVAAYISKYLVKVEDAKACTEAPGGLAHLAAALEGRRLFGAWGCGAVARRWKRQERPEWLARVHRHLEGYRNAAGELPVAASAMDAATGEVWSLSEVPRPPLPACVDPERLPDELELPKELPAWEWHNPGPLKAYAWPRGIRTAEELHKAVREKKVPNLFRWSRWWKATGVPKGMCGPDRNAHYLNPRRPTSALSVLAGSLRATVSLPVDMRDEGHPVGAVLGAVQDATKTVKNLLSRLITGLGWGEARAWANRLPADLRAYVEALDPYGATV